MADRSSNPPGKPRERGWIDANPTRLLIQRAIECEPANGHFKLDQQARAFLDRGAAILLKFTPFPGWQISESASSGRDPEN